MPPTKNSDPALQKVTNLLNSIMSRPDAGPFLEPVDWRGLELFDYPEIVKHPMDLGTIKRKLERQQQYQNAAEVARDIRLVWSNCMLFNTERSDFWLLAKSLSKRFEDRYRKIKAEYDCGDIEKADDSEDEEEEGDDNGGGADEEDNEDDLEEDEDEDELEDDDDDDDEAAASDVSPASTRARSDSHHSSNTASGQGLDAKARFVSNMLLLNGVELGYVITQLEQHCPEALQISKDVQDRMEIMVDEIKDSATFSKLSQYVSEKAAAQKRSIAMPVHDISKKRRR